MIDPELDKRIKVIEDWMKQRQSNQLKDPLDLISKALLQKDIPIYKGTSVPGAVAVGGYITVFINNVPVNILIK